MTALHTIHHKLKTTEVLIITIKKKDNGTD